MPNWPDVWNNLGKELGVKLEDLEPTRLTIGGVGTAELLSRKFPIVWVKREILELGTLELHKQMFEQREFPWLTLDSAGAETTLGHLQGIVQKGASREEQSIALDGARTRFAKNPAFSWNEHRTIDWTSLIFTTCYSDSLYLRRNSHRLI